MPRKKQKIPPKSDTCSREKSAQIKPRGTNNPKKMQEVRGPSPRATSYRSSRSQNFNGYPMEWFRNMNQWWYREKTLASTECSNQSRSFPTHCTRKANSSKRG